jgi:hypothetical protein
MEIAERSEAATKREPQRTQSNEEGTKEGRSEKEVVRRTSYF